MTLAADAVYAVAENADPDAIGGIITTCGKISGELLVLAQWLLDNLLGILQGLACGIGT